MDWRDNYHTLCDRPQNMSSAMQVNRDLLPLKLLSDMFTHCLVQPEESDYEQCLSSPGPELLIRVRISNEFYRSVGMES